MGMSYRKHNTNYKYGYVCTVTLTRRRHVEVTIEKNINHRSGVCQYGTY